ncbi:hypothetical protein HNQ07_000423 [Deinococcus metalli]|nr:hypothetical protein [Deinococcus metalli]MBB5374979.1 hypothetical protein [Deinococcus metalli]
MSRGPGRVQRAILQAVEGGPLDVWTLTLYAQASESSTRRALRALARAGRVASLGYGVRGGQRWGLPVQVAAMRAVADSFENLPARMGARFACSFRRCLISAL